MYGFLWLRKPSLSSQPHLYPGWQTIENETYIYTYMYAINQHGANLHVLPLKNKDKNLARRIWSQFLCRKERITKILKFLECLTIVKKNPAFLLDLLTKVLKYSGTSKVKTTYGPYHSVHNSKAVT